MVRTPLVVLALLLLGSATGAGPPGKVSGEMVFDEFADGLRRYRQETNPKKRADWLRQLAPTGEPRVIVALGEALYDKYLIVQRAAAREMVDRYALLRVSASAMTNS